MIIEEIYIKRSK